MVTSISSLRVGILCLLIALPSVRPVCAENARPVTAGVALAYPKSPGFDIVWDLTATLDYDIRVPLHIFVDSDGSVSDVALELTADSSWFTALDSGLRSVQFEPGQVHGSSTSQRLSIDCLLTRGSAAVRLKSPVGESATVTDAAWYSESLRANGVRAPSIVRLAPYFIFFRQADSVRVLPTALFSVSVGQSGSCDDIRSIW